MRFFLSCLFLVLFSVVNSVTAQSNSKNWQRYDGKIALIDFEVSGACARGLRDTRGADHSTLSLNLGEIQVRPIRERSKCTLTTKLYEVDKKTNLLRRLNIAGIKIGLFATYFNSDKDFSEVTLNSAFTNSQGEAQISFNWLNGSDTFYTFVDYSREEFYKNLDKNGYHQLINTNVVITKTGLNKY